MPPESTIGCDMLVWIRPEAVTPMTTGRAAGQVVIIKDCPHSGWGRAECPPDFKVIHVPDKRKEDLEFLTAPYLENHPNTPEENALEFPPQLRRHARRKRRIDVNSLNESDVTAIMEAHDETYHALSYSIFADKIFDDSEHSVLSPVRAKTDSSDAQRRVVAEIRLGVRPEPEGWETNKELFKDIDTSVEELAIIAQIENGTIGTPKGWDHELHRIIR